MASDEKKVTKKKAAKKTASKKTVTKKTAAKKATVKKTEPAEAVATKPATKAAGRVRVTLVKSLIGTIGHHRDTVRGLGLRRINHTVELEDTPAIRGMVKKVQYLVRVEKD